jgi:hypothetical protein
MIKTSFNTDKNNKTPRILQFQRGILIDMSNNEAVVILHNDDRPVIRVPVLVHNDDHPPTVVVMIMAMMVMVVMMTMMAMTQSKKKESSIHPMKRVVQLGDEVHHVKQEAVNTSIHRRRRP